MSSTMLLVLISTTFLIVKGNCSSFSISFVVESIFKSRFPYERAKDNPRVVSVTMHSTHIGFTRLVTRGHFDAIEDCITDES